MILALDMSTKSTGWSIFDNNGDLKDYGCITSSSTILIKRIYIMRDSIKEILNKYEIKKIIVEEVRPDSNGINSKTLKALMYLQAALEFLIYDNFNKIEIEYIYPNSWRSQIGIHTGKGIKRDKLKEEDIKFVKNKYNIDVNDDIADSICIGLSNFSNKKNSEFIIWE